MLFGRKLRAKTGLRVWTRSWMLDFDVATLPQNWRDIIVQPKVERAILALLSLLGSRGGPQQGVPRISWSLVTARLHHELPV